ncbi:MAG: guanylate kinase [Firmicutes bacterium]|nr:guanylate kinase [Bacillota bacterium]
MARGLLFVISGPSGVGKNSVLNGVLKERNDIFYSISATTRPPRRNEVNGKDYYFLTKDEFEKAIKSGELLEWALVYGNYYGTPRKAVEERLNNGQHVIMDLDIQGAANVRNNLPEAVLIFLLPPSREELKRRLLARKSEAKAAVEKRLACLEKELASITRYDYVVMNDLLENACRKVAAIITAEEARVDRGYWREQFLF